MTESRKSQNIFQEFATRYSWPFTYIFNHAQNQLDNIVSWKKTFGEDGGQLDTETGVKIDVARNPTRSNGRAVRNRRKISTKITADEPLEETDQQIIVTPVLEIKPVNFNENDKFELQLPVSAKVKDNNESQSNTKWSVMRRHGNNKGFEEVDESQWQLYPEESNIQVTVTQPTLKMLIFAVLRSISGPIWQYIQITMHMSLYGPQQLEQSMCLQALFCKSRYPSLSSDNPEHWVRWTRYDFQINDYQKIDVTVGIQGSRQQQNWEVDKSKIDSIYKEDLRAKQKTIQRTIPMSFEPKDDHKLEKFNLTLSMHATDDKQWHHHSCTSPGPNSTSFHHHSNPDEEPSNCHDTSSRSSSRQRLSRRGHQTKHAKCNISMSEMALDLVPVRAKKDFLTKDDKKRENLLNLQKGEVALILGSSQVHGVRHKKSSIWNIGISGSGEIGFFSTDQVETLATKTDGPCCTADNILSFVQSVCASEFLMYDCGVIKNCVADKLRSKWRELARLELMVTAEIDAIMTDAMDEKEEVIRFLDKMEQKRGKHGIHGYLPSLVCELMKIGMRQLAMSVTIEALFYTIAMRTACRWKEFEKELNSVLSERETMASCQHFIKLNDSEMKPVEKTLIILKRCYHSNKLEFLKCLQYALRDKKWRNGDFTECELLTEKVYMVSILQYHLCTCDLEDRQIY
ncbi:uncharacterized protein LOC144447259 [Glandiceps talaboti]